MNEAVLFNMRNAYQNYNVAVNLSDRVITHTWACSSRRCGMPTTAPPAS